MNIRVENLSFRYHAEGRKLFDNFTAYFGADCNPLVILGPSGSGKTTLLKLLCGLLMPDSGRVIFGREGEGEFSAPDTAFMFQEPRLLPWLTALENAALPLEKKAGKALARERAKGFLDLVSLGKKGDVFPRELSGGEARRVSLARAFAWPAAALFMDEPFESLDIPLRIQMMNTTLSLVEREGRFLAAVTHDPREAVYLGRRIVVLGKRGEGIVYDRKLKLAREERVYGSAAALAVERELIRILEE